MPSSKGDINRTCCIAAELQTERKKSRKGEKRLKKKKKKKKKDSLNEFFFKIIFEKFLLTLKYYI